MLALLFRHRKLLTIVGLVSLVASFCVTMMIQPKYLAFGIIFPTNSNTRNELLSNPQFGYEIDADRMMQLLESEYIRNTIIDKHQLIEYYDIDTLALDWKLRLDKQFVKDITFFRSKYMSIVISANMHSPQKAAAIVNDIIDLVDKFQEKVLRENMTGEYEFQHTLYVQKKATVDSLLERIYAIKKPTGPEDLLSNYFIMASQQNVPKEAYDYVNSTELENLINTYRYQRARLQALTDANESARIALERPIPKNYVIDRAKPYYKKSYPSYTLNCLIGTLGSLLLVILVLLFRRKWQSLQTEVREEAGAHRVA